MAAPSPSITRPIFRRRLADAALPTVGVPATGCQNDLLVAGAVGGMFEDGREGDAGERLPSRSWPTSVTQATPSSPAPQPRPARRDRPARPGGSDLGVEPLAVAEGGFVTTPDKSRWRARPLAVDHRDHAESGERMRRGRGGRSGESHRHGSGEH